MRRCARVFPSAKHLAAALADPVGTKTTSSERAARTASFLMGVPPGSEPRFDPTPGRKRPELGDAGVVRLAKGGDRIEPGEDRARHDAGHTDPRPEERGN